MEEDENGMFMMPVDEDDNAQDPPAPLNLPIAINASSSDALEAMEIVDDDDDDTTRPALQMSDGEFQVPAPVAARQVQPLTEKEHAFANEMIQTMVRAASNTIPFVCVAPGGKIAASVQNGLGTATFCHIVKYLVESSEGLNDPTLTDVGWAARLLAYACVRDHHTVPQPRQSHFDEFESYMNRMADVRRAAQLLVKGQLECCVVIQEDWPQQAGCGRIYLLSSFTRRHIWAVLAQVFTEFRISAPPFYDEDQISESLDERHKGCWTRMLQELRAKRSNI